MADGPLREDVLQHLLKVARELSASADLNQILSAIIDAMRDTLTAERATVFEYDSAADELVTTVAHGIVLGHDAEPTEIRIPANAGLAGECAQTRRIINVPDAYADDRFNPDIDKKTGFRTRSILTIPLIGHDQELVGVAQVLNKHEGTFDDSDEEVADALAAQAAVAMKRGRLIEDRLMRQKLERDLELARSIQQSSFPDRPPRVRGFDIDAWSEPAEQTGGDAYDLVELSADRAMAVMADATGHGVGPALSVTQLRSMLRMAARLGADLLSAAHHVNQQLCADLPPGRFVTAWLGLIDGAAGVITSFSAGQAPLLHYVAATGEVRVIDADMPPFGVVNAPLDDTPESIRMAPGDLFAVISDGVYEAMNDDDEQFGTDRVCDVVRGGADLSPADLSAVLRAKVLEFTDGRPADDDRTAILIKAADDGASP